MTGSPANGDSTITTRSPRPDAVVVALGGEHDLASTDELDSTFTDWNASMVEDGRIVPEIAKV